MQVSHCIWGEKIQIIWAAGGLSLLVRSSSCGSAGAKVAPKVALLPRHCPTACPLRASYVNPCRGHLLQSAHYYFEKPFGMEAAGGIEQGCPQGRKGMGPRAAQATSGARATPLGPTLLDADYL